MTAGKITLFAILSGAILSATTLAAYFQILVPFARASTVSTTVTVLNTPPQWDTYVAGVDQGFAHEVAPSATNTPTNVGFKVSFTAQATDSGNDAYFLIICGATSTAPTPHDNAPPTCAGGNTNNEIAISATTTSGTAAVAATTTVDDTTWAAEKYDWTGWICDAHVPGAACNQIMENGEPNDPNYPDSASPFVVNHPPHFTAVVNDSPKNPGQKITWTTTATDTDLIRGGDMIHVYVCKTASFATSSSCAGGAWATGSSTIDNPTASTTLAIPTQDATYNAFVYLEDQNFSAATTSQGTNSSFVVNNVAPSVDATQVSLINYDSSTTLSLLNPAASTSNYQVKFQVTDNNGCQNITSGNEVVSASTTVYRSGYTIGGRTGALACQGPSDFDSNACYPSNGGGYTNFICTQDAGSCTGASDISSTWTCTFSLWFNADPTDSGSKFSSDNWQAGVQVTDDNGALSNFATSTTGDTLDSFLAFSVSTTTIGYGGLQPGQSTSPIVQTTDLQEQGNVGLNEFLYGDTMCSAGHWTSPDSCDHYYGSTLATSTIPVNNQKFATSSVAYTSIQTTALTSSSSPTLNDIRVPKTIATTSIQTKNTFWGIAVPAAVTLSGDYVGQDTITATRSNSSFW